MFSFKFLNVSLRRKAQRFSAAEADSDTQAAGKSRRLIAFKRDLGYWLKSKYLARRGTAQSSKDEPKVCISESEEIIQEGNGVLDSTGSGPDGAYVAATEFVPPDSAEVAQDSEVVDNPSTEDLLSSSPTQAKWLESADIEGTTQESGTVEASQTLMDIFADESQSGIMMQPCESSTADEEAEPEDSALNSDIEETSLAVSESSYVTGLEESGEDSAAAVGDNHGRKSVAEVDSLPASSYGMTSGDLLQEFPASGSTSTRTPVYSVNMPGNLESSSIPFPMIDSTAALSHKVVGITFGDKTSDGLISSAWESTVPTSAAFQSGARKTLGQSVSHVILQTGQPDIPSRQGSAEHLPPAQHLPVPALSLPSTNPSWHAIPNKVIRGSAAVDPHSPREQLSSLKKELSSCKGQLQLCREDLYEREADLRTQRKEEASLRHSLLKAFDEQVLLRSEIEFLHYKVNTLEALFYPRSESPMDEPPRVSPSNHDSDYVCRPRPRALVDMKAMQFLLREWKEGMPM